MLQIFCAGGIALMALASCGLPVRGAPPGNASSVSPQRSEVDGEMLDSIERVRCVSQQAIAAEVRATLVKARQHMAVDPAGVSHALALVRRRVSTAPELDSAERDQMLAQIAAAMRKASRIFATTNTHAIGKDQAQLGRAARQNLDQELHANQQAAAERIAHVNELAASKQYRQAEEAARRVGQGAQAEAAGTALAIESRSRANIAEMQALAERGRQNLSEEFRTEDAQQAVNSDDPPIIYPAAAKWQALSERRKKWGETASTYRPGPGEERINKALRETTSIDFQNMPLSDAIDYLKVKHGIEIQLDSKNLSLAALSNAVPVTCKARGVSLRSALRLILNDLDLSWIVRDDVLLITTKEQADSVMSTRIYPVGDLVIPVQNPFFGLPGGMPF